jgi:hypothetical protein
MPTGMDSDTRAQRKAWRQRNSDGRNTFEGEKTQSPPTWDYVEDTLPPTATTDSPDTTSGYDRRAIREVHVFDPALVDPDA